jgi:shikimate dehydrogenase
MIALQENGVDVANKKLILLGAGGAAKAIAYKAAQDVDELVILNRTENKAKKLANMLSNTFDTKITSGTLSSSILKTELENADILINATSIGMHPDIESSLVPLDLLHSNLCVMDIIYNPLTTKMLRDAKSVGATTVSGLEMLIYQGAVAFEIWTNCPAPVEVMRNAALNALAKRGVHC